MIEILNTKQIPLSKLSANNGQIEGIPKNPRFIKTERYQKLVKSIQDNPEFLGARELIVHEYNGKFVVLCGNMRFRASKELGFDSIPCKVIPEYFSIEQIKAIIIKDNISFGDDDFDALANEWDAVELEDWGLELPVPEIEIEELEAKEDDYDTTPPIKPITILGDLYEIGEHRLLCGDSTDSDQVAKLMNGQKADMVFTDPPYGIDWNTDYTRFKGGLIPSENKYSKIQNDEKEFDPSFFMAMYDKCLFFGANCFSNKLPKGNWIVWDKRFENGKAFLADAEVAWYNGSGAVYIIAETHQGFVSSDEKRHHPTQKPVKLIQKVFEKINAPNFLFDPYSGSGSTMVASHQLKRKCYGMELDPKYCDVIVKRMIKLDPTLKIKRNGILIDNTIFDN